MKRYKKIAGEEQEELDMKCLQLLRATIQNLIDKLPDGWEENLSKHQRYEAPISRVPIMNGMIAKVSHQYKLSPPFF